MPKNRVTFEEAIHIEINRVKNQHDNLTRILRDDEGLRGFDDLTQAIRDYKVEIRTLKGVLSLHEELNSDV